MKALRDAWNRKSEQKKLFSNCIWTARSDQRENNFPETFALYIPLRQTPAAEEKNICAHCKHWVHAIHFRHQTIKDLAWLFSQNSCFPACPNAFCLHLLARLSRQYQSGLYPSPMHKQMQITLAQIMFYACLLYFCPSFLRLGPALLPFNPLMPVSHSKKRLLISQQNTDIFFTSLLSYII